MKEKIAFPQLVELVAEKASTTSRMSELFLQELFATISQALGKGEMVKIKGLGTFKTEKDDDGKKVAFIPDNALAEAVNAPFAQFKPVELCDEVTQEQLDEIDAEMQPEPVATATVVEPVEVVEPAQDVVDEVEKEEEEIETIEEPQQEATEPAAELQEEAHVEQSKPSNKRKWIAIAAGVAAVALVGGVAMHYMKSGSNETKAQTDSIATPKPAAAPIVTDTLRDDNRLFDMAQRHFGDQAFWVYIALENQQQFPDYHKIPKGAAVVIPPAEKYGINSDSKQSLKNAAKAAAELKAATTQKVEPEKDDKALEKKELKEKSKDADAKLADKKEGSEDKTDDSSRKHHHRHH